MVKTEPVHRFKFNYHINISLMSCRVVSRCVVCGDRRRESHVAMSKATFVLHPRYTKCIVPE